MKDAESGPAFSYQVSSARWAYQFTRRMLPGAILRLSCAEIPLLESWASQYVSLLPLVLRMLSWSEILVKKLRDYYLRSKNRLKGEMTFGSASWPVILILTCLESQIFNRVCNYVNMYNTHICVYQRQIQIPGRAFPRFLWFPRLLKTPLKHYESLLQILKRKKG